MDLDNPVINLCLAGTRAEFEGRRDDARALYEQAWDAATDDYEACIAAHYVARFQDSAQQTLRWNQGALDRAQGGEGQGDARIGPFFPSLYLSLGRAYETFGEPAKAQQYYGLAAELDVTHEAP